MGNKTISAEIIADSVNENGNRITSFVLTFPRFILAELNTHRTFSRNSASSRAIPFKKMVKMVQDDPFIPIAWQKDHKGMQGAEYITNKQDVESASNLWLDAADNAAAYAGVLSDDGVTKQLCNRILEPFLWHTAIVTATEFENFFKLRCPQYEFGHEDAVESTHRSKKDWLQEYHAAFDEDRSSWSTEKPFEWWAEMNKGQGEIHIMALAEAMWDAMNESEPKQLKSGEWHIPFGDKMDCLKLGKLVVSTYPDGLPQEEKSNLMVKIATARCARVSYMNYDGTDDYEKDIALHDRLSKLRHWSPFEHCAQAHGAMANIITLNTTEMSQEEIEKFRLEWVKLSKETSPMIVSKEMDVEIQEIGSVCGNFRGWKQYRKTFEGESGVQ